MASNTLCFARWDELPGLLELVRKHLEDRTISVRVTGCYRDDTSQPSHWPPMPALVEYQTVTVEILIPKQ